MRVHLSLSVGTEFFASSTFFSQYNRAVELDPNNPTFRFNRAAAYMQLGMYQKCVEDCQFCIEINPNVAKFHLRKGRAYEKLGQMYEARISYQNGLRNDPGNPEIMAALNALPRLLIFRKDHW